ncbi:30S ribosomal protein S20 [Pelagibacterales bacterium SAG-MED15]|jgi:small subunit ribosomal protein S20|nr:30S ribosomal protein S20 [Pelagibacterales bacterium SAG-MED15]RZO50885.1 MAG: 30S ribosomal protein S20 [Pelagibacterales bacterium]|tara:strand:- start:64 stop:324 length:261 start_codon:yes stop_codon:yes gene_type:complete
MANTKSAIKTIRKNTRETLINKSRKSRFRTAIKKMNTLIEKKNKKDALSYLPKLNSELMKIAKTGIIKKGNATRNLSRLTKKINSL